MDTKHTALPWTTEEVGGSVAIIANNQAIAHVRAVYSDERRSGPANAAFIVTACNSHYELLDALKMSDRLVRSLVGSTAGEWTEVQAINAAISKAEGKS